ncbi:MAG: leucine-rich repeat protein, partial [Bacteroidales bacterium]|nr:leucine-rich repeat protein [Bacteroidales bacterium]
MRQKILLFLLLFAVFPTWATDGDTFEVKCGVHYVEFQIVDENARTCITVPGHYESTGSWGSGQTLWNASELVLPASPVDTSTGKAYKLIGIGEYSFAMSGMPSVVIPEGVTYIGQGAFYSCTKLSSITIPSTVTTIGDLTEQGFGVFQGCSALTAIGLPSSVTTIGYQIFCNCRNLESVTLPSSLTTISSKAFYGCSALKSINIPSSVTTIMNSAFANTPLKSITLQNVTKIGNQAFAFCTSLESATLNKALTSAGEAIFYSCSAMTTVKLNDAMTEIPSQMFLNCSKLTTINFPKKIQSIASQAFRGCSELKSADLSSCTQLTELGASAFASCTSLATVKLPTGLTKLGTAAFTSCPALTSITLPSTLTSIGNNAFYMSGLTSITIPSSVTSLGEGSFRSCKLTSVTIGNGVTKIPYYAFGQNANLSKITFPTNIQVIGDGAFYGCAIPSLNIPTTVTSIGSKAFYDMSACANITYQTTETLAVVADDAFYGSYSKPLYVASGMKAKFQAASGWNKFTNIQEIGIYYKHPKIVYAVNDYSSVPPVPLLDPVYAGAAGFSISIDNYSVVEYKEDVKNPYHAYDPEHQPETFSGWFLTGAKGTATITATLNGYNLSAKCVVTVLNDEITVGDYKYSISPDVRFPFVPDPSDPWIMYARQVAFVNGFASGKGPDANGLLTLPTSVTSNGNDFEVLGIRSGAFNSNTKIKSAVIPASYVSIGSVAFKNCSSLEAVYFEPGTETYSYSIGSNYQFPLCENQAFENCTNLKSVIWAREYLEIESDVFKGSSNIEDLVVDSSMASNEAFADISDKTIIPADATVENGLVISADGKLIRVSPTVAGSVSLDESTIGIQITSIEPGAFKGCSMVTSITLPSTVTSIGAEAFDGCSSLRSLDLSALSGLTTIEESTFNGCSALQSVDLPSGIKSIGDNAFNGCSSITEVAIPNGVASVGNGAFSGCSAMTSVVIPSTVTSIGDNAFNNCSGLTEISLPSGLKAIGSGTFSGCAGITDITIPEGVTTVGNNAFAGCSSVTTLVIPSTVTTIGASAFSGTSVSNVMVPSSVTSIAADAFKDCRDLTMVYYPKSVGTLTLPSGAQAAQYNSDETPVVINGIIYGTKVINGEQVPVTVIGVTGKISGTVVIPETVTTIEAGAFKDCSDITEVIIPKGVTTIGANAFEGSSLTEVVIPASVTSIGAGAFNGCDNLSLVVYPETMTSGVQLPGGVNAVSYPADVTPVIIDGVIYGTTAVDGKQIITTLISVPEDKEGTVVIPASVTTIEAGAFKGCSKVTAIELPDNLITIGDGTFEGTAVTNLIIPSSVTSVGEGAFSGCSNLTTVVHPASLDVKVPENVKTATYSGDETPIIENGFIYGATVKDGQVVYTTLISVPANATSPVKVPDTITTIAEGAFSGCTNVTEVELPEGLKEIGNNAFAGSGITSIDIPEGVTTIGSGAFSGTAITQVVLPESVTSVGSGAFEGCSSLTTVVYPATLGQSIEVPSTVNSVSYEEGQTPVVENGYVYGTVDGVKTVLISVPNDAKSVVIPETVTSIYKGAFEGCTELTKVTIPGTVK